MTPEKHLTDSYGRTIKSLRISITDRCNLNCIYCHNEGNMKVADEMSAQKISDIIKAASMYGVDRVKFSGGEPLVRRDFEDILKSLPPLKDVSATTNGILLEERARSLKDAGLDRINVSLDSIDDRNYSLITAANPGDVHKVLRGIEKAIEVGLTPVKLNMVMLKGVNEDKIDQMLEFVRKHKGNTILQLIQLMDFQDVIKYQVDVEEIEKQLEEKADEVRVRKMHRRKKYIIDGAEVEVVRPIDNTEFCANCNRLRVTADGKLKPCLLVNDNLVDTKGANAEDIPRLLEEVVKKRVPYYRGNVTEG
ncbi:GTP 3',8-cyclase MoaA [Methanohalophilus mahii]|uniref:Probable GTP 3',8-cyclase n=1 Tax=Methanohalophilus mahii (strain ATCC 35705 / DSM 5219 / SLP) TaxID=547558 RepID=D5E9Q8_METMS|nr:GTP 3',8-cyclase MoaA [Methanohalophilus mahii]ADE35909.1 GTP cyclohydrolase subunit MoaA [Methanohalophilus mahii DSM 5219]